MDIPRLDILLYAHDGRGLGHASRTIGIGLALRRLFPELRVLFVSGLATSQELIGDLPLDWVKLPSYKTEVVQGKSRGIDGNCCFSDKELGELRQEQLRQMIEIYRPRLVLADHSPQGKHRELLPAIEQSKECGTKWVLGIRGVIGEVGQLSSDLAREIFVENYSSLLWYGDSQVLGKAQLKDLEKRFGKKPLECGYVSRLNEVLRSKPAAGQPIGGTVSVPWFGEQSPRFLHQLHNVLQQLGDDLGSWHLYLDGRHKDSEEIHALFSSLSHCRVETPGPDYLHSLARSSRAIVYGGYNSIMDVLSLGTPSLIILREMKDNEQQLHIEKLLVSSPTSLLALPETCSEDDLLDKIRLLSSAKKDGKREINLEGAETAAGFLANTLTSCKKIKHTHTIG